MNLVVVGLNNKTASLDIREKIYFSKDNISEAYKRLNSLNHINSSVILSTCNRVEIYCTVTDYDQAVSDIIDFISDFQNFKKNNFIKNLYIKKSEYAVEHLFKVISSIDSMVIGEDQIQGQIRDAYLYAFENVKTDGMLNKLFQSAIQLGKRIRTETEINHGSVSIGSIAADLIIEKFNHNIKILVIGASEIADLTLTNLTDRTKADIYISNRSEEKALMMATKFQGKTIEFSKREESYQDFDVILTATSSKEYIIDENNINYKGKTQVFIDLSVPRNIAPNVSVIEGVELVSIENFDSQLKANKLIREEAIADVKNIIREEAQEFYNWQATQTIIPVMKGIKSELTEISLRTMNEYHTFMNSLTEEQKEQIKLMLLSSNDKLIRIIMKNLKSITAQSDLHKIATTLKTTFNTNL